MSSQGTITEAVDVEKPESEPLGLNRLLGGGLFCDSEIPHGVNPSYDGSAEAEIRRLTASRDRARRERDAAIAELRDRLDSSMGTWLTAPTGAGWWRWKNGPLCPDGMIVVEIPGNMPVKSIGGIWQRCRVSVEASDFVE